ncbi:hypothetical protein ACK8GG_06755 [Micromonosporaceae bacterium DT55]|uniref:hypothetical protein n=1 Tax=Melissospora conviva TaxID=3388432 RepID=UPI003C20ACF0
MGFFIRLNAFRGVSQGDVKAALNDFWSRHDRQVESLPQDPQVDAFDLHEQCNGWTAMVWSRGWEWNLRRAAQLHVSRVLDCAGILVFVYDGDDWGYELFDRGVAVDWFIQWPRVGNSWFPGKDLSGRPEAVVAAFPDLALQRSDVAPYLVQGPDDEEAEKLWDVRVRPADRFSRGQAEVALDFINLLRVIDVTEEGFVFPPLWCRFRVEPPPDLEI